MAELDDFFAKKDKKKSKVKKFTASDLMTSAKFQSEDVAQAPVAPAPSSAPRKVEKKKEEVVESHQTDSPAEPVTAAQPRTRPAEAEDEEWGEFEQEKERDYSGLKIQKLQIQDYEEEEEEDEGEHELNEEGELVKREPTGPWNKITSQPTSSNGNYYKHYGHLVYFNQMLLLIFSCSRSSPSQSQGGCYGHSQHSWWCVHSPKYAKQNNFLFWSHQWRQT